MQSSKNRFVALMNFKESISKPSNILENISNIIFKLLNNILSQCLNRKLFEVEYFNPIILI